MKSGLGASWLPRVGWEGGLGVSHGSQEWGGKGLGKLTMKVLAFLMVPKSGVGKAWEGAK